MEYSPMMVVMLWALTPSDATSIAAKVQELPTPGMTVHQESYFTFNHGKPFVAEQDPLTGAILNLKTTPVSQDDYIYEEEEEGDGIDRKDSPKIFTRNDIAHPSKDADLHKFLNLPVHYSSSGKFPLISSSYANTKVQGHSASTYSNHRLSPTTSTSTVSPSYYSLKTSTSVGSTVRTTLHTTTTSSTTSPTTTTTTARTTTTTTQRPSAKTTTKPPPSYEYEYEYEYDNEQEKEPSTDKKTTTHSILNFFDKDYELLGASEEEKIVTKTEPPLPSTNEVKKTSEKPSSSIEMIAPNTNIFIPSDYLKPGSKNKSAEHETSTVKLIISTETIINNTTEQSKLQHNERLKPTNIEIVKDVQSSENVDVNEKVEHGSFGLKISASNKPEITTKEIETVTPTTQYAEKKPVVFFPTSLPVQVQNNETKISSTTEENDLYNPNPGEKRPVSKPSEVIVPPSRTEFHYPYVKPVNKPQDIISQQSSHYNPYQRPFTPPTIVSTEMLPPQKPLEAHYQRPQYQTIDQNRPENQKRPNAVPPNRPIMFNVQENKQTVEQTSQTPLQHFLPTPMHPTEPRPYGILPQKIEPKPFSPALVGMRPGIIDPVSTLINRPHSVPHKQVSQSRPENLSQTRAPLTESKPNIVQTQPIDTRYPLYSQLPPHESENKPYLSDYMPQNSRPEQLRPPLVTKDFLNGHETKSGTSQQNQQEGVSFSKHPPQFNQPSKVESHFIKLSPGQENPSYSLQTSFSIGVPPAEGAQQGVLHTGPTKVVPSNQGVGQVLFPDDEEKRPWTYQEEKKPLLNIPERDKYPRPSWESHLKPPLVYNHLRKEPLLHKRPKPRPDLPNILPQFRPNAKVGHAEPQMYFRTPLDTLQPPPLPRPQYLRAELEEEIQPVHRRNGQSTRVTPIQSLHTPKRGALRSEDEKTDPVFVVYPSNSAQDGVVVGTRGSQRPLPPDNLEIEDSFPLDSNKNFQARVDTPILKGKVTSKPIIKNDFPYTLIKPTELEEKVTTTVSKEYTAFSPTISPTEKEHDAEINVIPYLQDYQPFATKKPLQESPGWKVGNDTKPISATLKTQKTEVTTSKIDNHKTNETPTPQDFQAPFHASLTAPNQGWSVLRPRADPEKEEETTTTKLVEEPDGKFDIQNFKPQLFGGFKPIIPPLVESKGPTNDDKENL